MGSEVQQQCYPWWNKGEERFLAIAQGRGRGSHTRTNRKTERKGTNRERYQGVREVKGELLSNKETSQQLSIWKKKRQCLYSHSQCFLPLGTKNGGHQSTVKWCAALLKYRRLQQRSQFCPPLRVTVWHLLLFFHNPCHMLTDNTAGPWITFCSTLFCYNVDERLEDYNSYLYQWAYGKIGFVILCLI